MDEKTTVLVSIGVAIAENCEPCFRHFMKRAENLGIAPEEVREILSVAERVKKGASIHMKGTIEGLLGTGELSETCCSGRPVI